MARTFVQTGPTAGLFLSRALSAETITRIFLEAARVRDQVAGARSPSNYRFRTWTSCRVSDRSRCKRHPFPLKGWNAFWGQHEISARERSVFSTLPTREVPVRRHAFQ